MKNLTIARRLALGFVLIVIINALATFVSVRSLRDLAAGVTFLSGDSLPGMLVINAVERDALTYRILTNRHLLAEDDAEKRQIDQLCDEHAQTILQRVRSYERHVTTAEERRLFEQIEPTLNRFRDVAKRIRAMSREGKQQEAVALLRGEGASTFNAFEQAVAACVDYNEKAARSESAAMATDAGRSLTMMLVLGGGSLLAASLAGWLITRGINRHLRRVADGLSGSAAQVAAASGQVSAASQSLAEGSSEQAASLEETSASLEEMASMTKRNAESAGQAKDLSAQTRVSADAGSVQMDEMRRAMDAIKASSNDISAIIKTIDEIAFQTNILALNAAVEAARAGEAGAGFAVVADEVRALAQRAAQAAKETAGKIEDAIHKSDHGVTISAEVAKALGEIVDKARKVDAFVAEIATASHEQNQGIGQVSTAVSQMDKVTQSNAGNAEETAAAAEELNAQAQSMQENVAELLRLVGGASERTVLSVPVAPAVKSSPRRTPGVPLAPGRAQRKPEPVDASFVN